jgi:DNA-binding cell septation regulator SpoVG
MGDLKMTTEMKRIQRGQLRAFCDVTLSFEHGELTLKGCRVIQKDGQEPWIAFPTNSYEKDGKTINKPVLEFSQTLRRMITTAILAEYDLQA